MSARDLGGWKALFAAEPWGWHEEWHRFAAVIANGAAPHRDVRMHPAPFTVDEFIPKRSVTVGEPKPTTPPPNVIGGKPAHMLRMMESMSIALHGQDNRKQRPRYD